MDILKSKFDLIIFHDCEPNSINHYEAVEKTGFTEYYLKTPMNWTALLVRMIRGWMLLVMRLIRILKGS